MRAGEQFDTASEQDLLACFRLLYGRRPSEGEWKAGLRQVGGSLRDMVAAHLKAAGAGAVPQARADVGQVELPGFRMFADRQDAAVGKHVLDGAYEPDVTSVFRTLLQPSMGVIDVGANIGYFTMLSASLVGTEGYVLAVEPNPRNARFIEASRRLNGFEQVQVAQVAAGPETGMLALNTSYSTGTTSDMPDGASLLGATTVLCTRPDALVPAGRRIHLIKVDVDGSDHKALLGCTEVIARHKPLIISEFSPGLLPGLSGISGEEYLQWFIGQGYGLSIIQPDGSLTVAGVDWQLAMEEYAARNSTHIDILAAPA